MKSLQRSLFLTGANGYLGRAFCQAIGRERFAQVVCLVRPGSAGRLLPGFTPVEGDLLNGDSYRSKLAGCDTVLHMAALTGAGKPSEYFRVNVEGTRVLAEECRKAGGPNLLFVSSIAAAFRDQYRYHYGRSKQQAEEIVRGSGLRYTIVRPAMIFGPGAPVLEGLKKLAGGAAVLVPGDGKLPVQPVFAGDVVHGLLELLREGKFDNRTLEMGGPEIISMTDLLLAIRAACGSPPARVIHVPLPLVRLPLGLLETILRAGLPVTAGQFASFANPGTCRDDGLPAQYLLARKNIREMLQFAANGSTGVAPGVR